MTDTVIVREHPGGRASVTVNGSEVIRVTGKLHTWHTVHHAWIFLWLAQRTYKERYGESLNWQIQIEEAQ